MKRLLAVLCIALLSGCAARGPSWDSSAFEEASPRSILVVPVVNQSLDVEASNYLLSALPVPLAEQGYYVFPVNTTKIVLEQEGYYEAERVEQLPPPELAGLFDADAILYVTINRWDARYVLVATTVTVDISYRLVSRDGVELWKTRQKVQSDPQGQEGSQNSLAELIAKAIGAAMTRAAPEHMPLARQANRQAFVSGAKPIPHGPYKADKSAR